MPQISKGSTVLVTGANGFVGSHVVDQLLQAGYNVVGVVRSHDKGAWLLRYFDSKYGPNRLKLFVVPDLTVQGSLDDAVRGCEGVCHTASDVSFSLDPDAVIPVVLSLTERVLEAVEKSQTVKRIVLTSSQSATVWLIPNKVTRITKESWNNHSVQQAYAADTNHLEKPLHVYCASKVKAEQLFWKWAERKGLEAGIQANTVVPNFVTGRILGRDLGQAGSTAGMLIDSGIGMKEPVGKDKIIDFLKMIPPTHAVDAEDTARLHIAGLVDPEVVNERIFAYSEPFNFNTLMQTLRKIRPQQIFPTWNVDPGWDRSEVVEKSRAEAIIQKNFGHGFRTLEESLRKAFP
ncbi:hypothetical protein EAE96_007847 [Botrytis aclada]|nr:hypothetical protein EAE96_007847 [Botrytis aclada]